MKSPVTYSRMNMSGTAVVWRGTQPNNCEVCITDLLKIGEFVDGAHVLGMWGLMCPSCHKKYGVGLGTGRGQRYRLINGEWVKQEG